MKQPTEVRMTPNTTGLLSPMARSFITSALPTERQ